MLDQSQCLAVAYFEVRRTLHAIQLMQVVRQHAGGKQALREVDQGIGIVIDSLEQHGLVEQGDAGLTQTRASLVHVGIQFLGVIGMQHHHLLQRQRIQPFQ